MNKEELINYVIKNGYTYNETKTTIDIEKIVDELENADESITFDKERKELMLWTTENGSGKAHILNEFELTVITIMKGWIE